MKYLVLNGSPRAKTSNSTRILNWLRNDSSKIEFSDIHYLAHLNKHEGILYSARDAQGYLFCFPLYVDSMPAQQKKFFELMEEQKEHFKAKPVMFIVHSGFPEMVQSESLKEYLEYFAREIMEMNLLGVVILAGSEALQMAPDEMYTRKIQEIRNLLPFIEEVEEFPPDINIRINKKKALSRWEIIAHSLNPFRNFYWHYRASRHDHKVRLKARPYL
jgi:NAD(P)H-dependent FMN reductase